VIYPEVDRCAWFDAVTARQKINSAQAELIDRLERALSVPNSSLDFSARGAGDDDRT
jgi:predicted NUDIX family NTP pyrophosphohydrolase